MGGSRRYIITALEGGLRRLEDRLIDLYIYPAMSLLVAKPQVACVIVGATTPVRAEKNVRAAGWAALTPKELEEIDKLSA